jgi:hypothetical protein
LRGAICLSTPFIICRHKWEGKELWARLVTLFLLSNMIFQVVLGQHEIHFLGMSQTLIRYLPLILFAAAPILFSLLVAGLGPRIYRRWPEISGRRFLDSFDGARLSPDQLLIVRSSGDEAAMAIGIFQPMTWLSNRAAQWLDRIYVSKGKIITLVFSVPEQLRAPAGGLILLVSAIFGIKWAPALMKDTSSAGGLLLFFGVAATILLLFALSLCLWTADGQNDKPEKWTPDKGILDWEGLYENVATLFNGVLGVLFFPLIAVTSLLTVAFGWDMPFFSLFLQFSVEPILPGKFTVLQLGVEDAPAFSHSLTYNNPAAIEEIIRWIKRDELDPA